MKINPLHAADFYKTGHVIQYPPGTTAVYSNYTPRSSVHANVSSLFDGKVVFVGLQGVIEWLLTDLWQKEFFNQDRETILRAYEARSRLEALAASDHARCTNMWRVSDEAADVLTFWRSGAWPERDPVPEGDGFSF